MVYHVVENASTDEVIINVPGRMVLSIEGVIISNPGTSAANVTLKDGDTVLITLSVGAGAEKDLPNLRGSKIYNNLTVNSSVAGVGVYVGIKEV